jgi:hypothetical protein
MENIPVNGGNSLGTLFQKTIDAILEKQHQLSLRPRSYRYDALDLDGPVIVVSIGKSAASILASALETLVSVAGNNEDICCAHLGFDKNGIERKLNESMSSRKTLSSQNMNTMFVVDTADKLYESTTLDSIIKLVNSYTHSKWPNNRQSIITLIDTQKAARESFQEHIKIVRQNRSTTYPLEFCFLLENQDEKARAVSDAQLSILVAYAIMLLNNTGMLNPTELKNSVGSKTDRFCSIAYEAVSSPLESLFKRAFAGFATRLLEILRDNAHETKAELLDRFSAREVEYWVDKHSRINLAVKSYPVFDNDINLGAYGALKEAEKDIFGDKLRHCFKQDVERSNVEWATKKEQYEAGLKKALSEIGFQPKNGLLYISEYLSEPGSANGSIQNGLVKQIEHLKQQNLQLQRYITEAYDSYTLASSSSILDAGSKGFWNLIFGKRDNTKSKQHNMLKNELQSKIYSRELAIVENNRKIELLEDTSQIIKRMCKDLQQDLLAIQCVTNFINQTSESDTNPFFISEIGSTLKLLLSELLAPFSGARVERLFRSGMLSCLASGNIDDELLLEQLVESFSKVVWPSIYEKYQTLKSTIEFLDSQGFSEEAITQKLYNAAEEDIAYPYVYVASPISEVAGTEVRFLIGDVDTTIEMPGYTRLYNPSIDRLEFIKLRIGVNPDNLFNLQRHEKEPLPGESKKGR